MIRRTPFAAAALLVLAARPSQAAENPPSASDTPSPVAATRAELKQLLEESKHAKPRLPLPPPTAEEIAKAKTKAAYPGLGGIINNGRMRQMYLPKEWVSGGFSREPDPAMTLTNAYKTMFFWIVSRANNCAYCQGHQETKLSADGVSEDTIAALDGDWSEFTPAERAAFALTKKLTYEPQAITNADIDALRPFYKDAAILEIVMTVAGNNAMNRWTGALRIPQEDHRVYLSDTSPKYANAESRIAPLDRSSKTKYAVPFDRGALPTSAEIEAGLEAARSRTPRIALVDESKARAIVATEGESGPVAEWVRLLATFPKYGPTRVAMHRATETKGKLDPVLKAQIQWVAAINDRAWYALGHAEKRLAELGQSDEQITALNGDRKGLKPGDQAVLALAKKLTVNPARITDNDIESIRAHFSDAETAEAVFLITEAAFFDRLTEAAGLRLER